MKLLLFCSEDLTLGWEGSYSEDWRHSYQKGQQLKKYVGFSWNQSLSSSLCVISQLYGDQRSAVLYSSKMSIPVDW